MTYHHNEGNSDYKLSKHLDNIITTNNMSKYKKSYKWAAMHAPVCVLANTSDCNAEIFMQHWNNFG